MLPGFYNPVLINPLISYSYLASASSGTTTSSYTFPGLSFGAEAADRMIHVVVHSQKQASGTWTSLTIGGVAATLVSELPAADAPDILHAYALVPTGATGSVVLTSSSTRNNAAVSLYRIVNWFAPPLVATQDTETVATISSSITRSLPGIIIGGGSANNGSGWAWTGLTEDYDASVENERYSSASLINAASGNLTVTGVVSGFSGRSRMSLCQWQ